MFQNYGNTFGGTVKAECRKIKVAYYMDISRIIKTANRQIELTEGSLFISKSHGTLQYYRMNRNGTRTYIKKGDEQVLTELAQKKYCQMVLKVLKQSNPSKESIASVLKSIPNELKKYISPFEIPVEDKVKQWKEEKYVRKYLPDDIISYQTDKGDKVRSKSEVIIANKLYRHGIPYRYENQWQLSNGMKIFPDFTIMNPKTGKLFIWEHFGLMSDQAYSENFVQKINYYAESNILPGDSLIVSFESQRTPISTEIIEKQISRFLS